MCKSRTCPLVMATTVGAQFFTPVLLGDQGNMHGTTRPAQRPFSLDGDSDSDIEPDDLKEPKPGATVISITPSSPGLGWGSRPRLTKNLGSLFRTRGRTNSASSVDHTPTAGSAMVGSMSSVSLVTMQSATHGGLQPGTPRAERYAHQKARKATSGLDTRSSPTRADYLAGVHDVPEEEVPSEHAEGGQGGGKGVKKQRPSLLGLKLSGKTSGGCPATTPTRTSTSYPELTQQATHCESTGLTKTRSLSAITSDHGPSQPDPPTSPLGGPTHRRTVTVTSGAPAPTMFPASGHSPLGTAPPPSKRRLAARGAVGVGERCGTVGELEEVPWALRHQPDPTFLDGLDLAIPFAWAGMVISGDADGWVAGMSPLTAFSLSAYVTPLDAKACGPGVFACTHDPHLQHYHYNG